MSEFFQGKAEFRQPHAFRNLEEVYPDGQPLPRIDDSDRIEFFESQRFRTGAKGKKQKKKTPDPPPAEEDKFNKIGRMLFDKVLEALADAEGTRIVDGSDVDAQRYFLSLSDEQQLQVVTFLLVNSNSEAVYKEEFHDPFEDVLKVALGIVSGQAVLFAIPEGGIDSEPAEDADVEVVGVSKQDPAKKQVKVKVEPEEVIEPEPESDVDSVDDDTEETQVLDAALKTLPKIK